MNMGTRHVTRRQETERKRTEVDDRRDKPPVCVPFPNCISYIICGIIYPMTDIILHLPVQIYVMVFLSRVVHYPQTNNNNNSAFCLCNNITSFRESPPSCHLSIPPHDTRFFYSIFDIKWIHPNIHLSLYLTSPSCSVAVTVSGSPIPPTLRCCKL